MKGLLSNKKFWFISLGTIALCIALVWINKNTSLFSSPGDFAADSNQRVELEVKKPIVLYGMVVNDLHVTEDYVKKNQRLADLFEGHYIGSKVWQQLNTLPRSKFDFRKIAATKKYTLITNHDSLKSVRALVYEPNAIDYIIFHMQDSLQIEVCQREVTVLEKVTAGVIESNLSQTVASLGLSNDLTNKFVDIFAWQVDFQRLQKGDRFKIIYEESVVEEKPIGIGKILGIYFEHFKSPYYAFPFDQGDGVDYFDEKGNSLRKALLKYPIEFTRISSYYNLTRFHPIAKVIRAHKGTDFAAPMGTPIRSAGDGIVLEAQYKTNSGNYVKVKHNATYTTGYLHMSKIASGMAPGTRVRQGQVIGYVGSTGLSTGPHLCYRFFKNGAEVDPFKIELPPSQPIEKAKEAEFSQVKLKMQKQLETIPFPAETEVTVADN